MKALVLAGGRGKRLKDASCGMNKCMINVLGRPLIEYSFENACRLRQIDEIVVVVGYRAEDITGRYGTVYDNKKITYVLQENQQGLVHAIECAESALDGADFMLLLADEYMRGPCHQEFLETFVKEKLFVLCGVVEVSDRTLIKKTYAVVHSNDRKLLRLIEKPNNPPNNIMGTGNCVFKNGIFSYIPQTPINQQRKEKELPDLIQCAIDDGKTVKTFPICQSYINVNTPAELTEAHSYFSHV